jgi:hypothetical protein
VLFAAGKPPKQVQVWLGHKDPAFTLRVYVHLLDDGLGDADFLDEEKWATNGPHEPRETEQTATPLRLGKPRHSRGNVEARQTQASAG